MRWGCSAASTCTRFWNSVRARGGTHSPSCALATVTHDVRLPLPVPDESFDAVYSHMLFTMA